MKIKQFFCKHKFEVKEATFEYGMRIPSVASHRLTWITIYSSDATAYYAAPYTVIKTHYVVKQKEKIVILCCKQCAKCGLITPCDAFSYEEFRNNKDMLTLEGF